MTSPRRAGSVTTAVLINSISAPENKISLALIV